MKKLKPVEGTNWHMTPVNLSYFIYQQEIIILALPASLNCAVGINKIIWAYQLPSHWQQHTPLLPLRSTPVSFSGFWLVWRKEPSQSLLSYLKQMKSVTASGHPRDSQPTSWVNMEELGKSVTWESVWTPCIGIHEGELGLLGKNMMTQDPCLLHLVLLPDLLCSLGKHLGLTVSIYKMWTWGLYPGWVTPTLCS